MSIPPLQSDQTVNAPFYIPILIAASAFLTTFYQTQLALPLLIVATAMDRYRFDFGGSGLRIEHFVFAGVWLAWFLRVRPRPIQLGFTRADLLLVAYLALSLISSVLYAPILRESLKFLLLMAFGILLYWLARAIALRPHEFQRAVWALVLTGVAASGFGILAWLCYPLGINLGVQIYSLDAFSTHSPYGTLFDSNTLGMYAMAATLIQITLLLDTHFSKYRVHLALGTLITLTTVALSLTRVAWIGLVFGLFLILLFSPRRKWALAIGGGAVLLVLIALLANSALAGGDIAQNSILRVLTSRSIFFRLEAYTKAWNDFLTSPLLGNGVNAFAQNYTSPSGTRDWISNFFLMTLHDTGILGLALLLTWLGWLALQIRQALQAQTTQPLSRAQSRRLNHPTTDQSLISNLQSPNPVPSRVEGATRTMLLALTIAYLALFVTYQATTVFWLGFNWLYLALLHTATILVKTQPAPPNLSNPLPSISHS